MRALALLLISIVPGVIAARTTANVHAAAACVAPLTLRLRPGLHYAPAGLAFPDPAPDIPAGTVVIDVPLYPGAALTAQHFFVPTLDYPDSPYLKAASAEYLLPIDPATAQQWYRQSFTRCGYRVTGSGESGDARGHTSTGITFTSRANGNLQVNMSFQALAQAGTVALYVATDVTVPPRRPASYLPADVVRVEVTYQPPIPTRGGGAAPRRLYRTIADPTAIGRLVAAINALSHVVAGAHTCPSGSGQSATLLFVRRGGQAISVYDDPLCMGVVVGHFPPLIDDHHRVWNTVTALVSAHVHEGGAGRSPRENISSPFYPVDNVG